MSFDQQSLEPCQRQWTSALSCFTEVSTQVIELGFGYLDRDEPSTMTEPLCNALDDCLVSAPLLPHCILLWVRYGT